MSDYNIPPIYLSPKQQAEGGSVVVFLSLGLCLAIICFVVFQIILPKYRLSDDEKIYLSVQGREASERFVDNFHGLIITLLTPAFSGLWETPWKIISWIFLVLWFISIIVIHTGLATIHGTDRNQLQIQWGLILFFIGLIGYFMTRTLSFYKRELDTRKKVEAGRNNMVGDTTNSSDLSESDANSISFDRLFRYKRRVKHISPTFKTLQFTFFNAVQCFVILTEFLQLVSFPLRDLFRSDSFLQSLTQPQGESSARFINGLRSIFSTFSTGLPATNLNYVKFIFCWWLTLIAAIFTFIFVSVHFLLQYHTISDTIPPVYIKWFKKISTGKWIVQMLPLINLSYLIILNSFLEPLGCLSSNTTPTWPSSFDDQATAAQARLLECNNIYSVSPIMNTSYSLVGFMLAYLLFTCCRISHEPIPEDGRINYTSRSELYLKNSAIVVLLLYTLVPTPDTASERGVLGCLIFLFMTLYNTVIGSTHCIYVNFVRTQAFLQSFWTSVIVTYYTNESRKQLLYETGSGMWSIIGWGWVIIGIIHYLLFRYVLVRWMDSSMKKDSERLPGDLPSIRDECITSPEMISEQKLESEPSNIDNDSHTSAKLENISIDGSVTHGTLATETSGDALSTLVEGHSTVKTAVDIPADEQNTKSKPLPTVPRPSVSSTARPSITGTSCRPSITGTTSRPSLPSIGRPSLPYSIGRPSQFNTERPSLHSVERPSIATTGRIIQIATAFKFEAVYDADQKIKLFGPRPLPDGIDDPISIYLAAQEDFKLATPLQAVSMSIEVEDAV